MLKIAFSYLRDPVFQDAMRRLYTASDLGVGTAYKVSKLCAAVQKELEHANAIWTKIIDKVAEKNPNGSIVEDPDKGKGFFKIREDKREEFPAMAQEFGKTEATIDGTPVMVEHLTGVKMAPVHVDILFQAGVLREGTAPQPVPLRPKKGRK